MARLPRYFVPGQPQHVILRGNNRAPIFIAEADYRHFLDCLRFAAQVQGLAIHAYVLMDNHVHLLATPASEVGLPKTLQSVGRKYVQHFNQAHERTGTLWEGRYKSIPIDSERYLLTVMRYIELNPVRAGMVAHPADYRWSSYRAHAHGEPAALLSDHALYRTLGPTARERQSAYRQLFRAQLPHADVDAIRASINKSWPLGENDFRDRIQALSGRRAAPLPRGRRRKEIESDPN